MALDQATSNQSGTPQFPTLARVVGHLDSTYMGILEVQLLRNVGNSNSAGNTMQVKMLSPFLGQTGADFVTPNSDYASTQKSYGMWMRPPDVGTLVVVIFVDGDTKEGYWVGCVQDNFMNFMLPGLAATELTVEQTRRKNPDINGKSVVKREPVAEFNKVINLDSNDADQMATLILKPTHPFSKVLATQGLDIDDVRGITTSSARRENPSNVFGISTPGPSDINGPTGKVGKIDQDGAGQVVVPVSRLGGTTFVMDDGNTSFRRKKEAGKGPPEYASAAAGESDGNPNIPHNELVRIRTRTGHQILLHNSEDLIYIGNAKGTAWVELTSNGKIDIYAADSISIHSKADLNIRADRDINMEAGRNMNVKVTGRAQTEVVGNYNLIVTQKGTIQCNNGFTVNTTGANILYSSLDTTLKSAANIITSGAKVQLNPLAVPATPAKVIALKTIPNVYNDKGGQIVSIMKRIPNQEPWPQHENLDPTSFTPAKTDREPAAAFVFAGSKDPKVPKYFNQYTTSTDSFRFISPLAK